MANETHHYLQVVDGESPPSTVTRGNGEVDIPKFGREVLRRTGGKRDAGWLLFHDAETWWKTDPEFWDRTILELAEETGVRWTPKLVKDVTTFALKHADKLGPAVTYKAAMIGSTLNLITATAEAPDPTDNLRRGWHCEWNKVPQNVERANKFIADIVRPEWRQRLLEACALAIFPMPDLQALLLFLGAPGQAKGVVSRIIAAIVGPDQIASVEPQSFSDSHATAGLVGKSLNLVGDASAADLTDPKILKKITGQDPVTINPKYQTSYSTRLDITILFTFNELPTINDPSNALGRRVKIVKFERQTAKPNDPSLTEKLTTPEMLSAFAYLFAHALWGIRDRGGLADNAATLAAIDEFRSGTNSVEHFISECCEVAPEMSVSRRALWQAFDAWSTETRIAKSVNEQRFATTLRSRPGIGEKKVQGVRHWTGLTLENGPGGRTS